MMRLFGLGSWDFRDSGETMKHIVAGCFVLVLVAAHISRSEGLIWQLGTDDGASKDFLVRYRAWEYGRAPYIASSKQMEHDTHTFCYDVNGRGVIEKVNCVEGIYTVTEGSWMNKDELVCNVRLRWDEASAGRRRITVKTASHENNHLGVNGIELRLPGGGRKVVNLPAGRGKGLEFSAVFDCIAGKNELVIANVSRAKHYFLRFDFIRLEATDAPVALPTVVYVSPRSFSGIHHPGDKVLLDVETFNGPSNGTLSYSVKDYLGQVVSRGTATVESGKAVIELSATGRGHFTLECEYHGGKGVASYAVVEPVALEYKPGSRFGCHATDGDGYRLLYDAERVELKVRRAWLGGAKWTRCHSASWALREPKKGEYDWRYLDERLALAKQYKLEVLLGIGQTPAWSSPSTDKSLTVCGSYRYLYYPPKNWADWGDFMKVLVRRYGGQVKHYEIGNEPGYTSAFWSNGSAPDYGMYLKTAYEAAKSVLPEAVIYPGAPLQVEFLDEALKSVGGFPYFDVCSAHYLGNTVRGGKKASAWLNLVKKYGKEPVLVNTEEMSWRHADRGNIEIAEHVVKLHVREASLGVIRTFGFEMFDDNSNSRYSFFDLHDQPLVQFCAYRGMTHRLEDMEYAGDLSGDDYEAYLFTGSGEPIIVFWRNNDGTVTLPLGVADATLVNLVDVERNVTGQGGLFTLKSGRSPQYVIGGNVKALKAFAKARTSLPQQFEVGKKAVMRLPLSLPQGVSLEVGALPSGWKGRMSERALDIAVPEGGLPGWYDCVLTLKCGALAWNVNVAVNVSDGRRGDLFENGGFERGNAHWFYAKPSVSKAVESGQGVDGGCALRITGTMFFGRVGKIKVRRGERYLLSYEVRGEGKIGGVVSVKDAAGKTLYPKRPGINCLYGVAGKDWRRFSEEFEIGQEGAEYLEFALLANYGDKEGKTLYVDNVTVARLTPNQGPSKVFHVGTYQPGHGTVKIDGRADEWSKVPVSGRLNRSSQVVGPSGCWLGENDLSCTFKVMMDTSNLYLLFDVRDDKVLPGTDHYPESWKSDSIQVGIDPCNDGMDFTELWLFRDAKGMPVVFKGRNYLTPELPDNITRRGVLKDAECAIRRTDGGLVYEVRLPLKELYPLRANPELFGFSFLLNDDDGQGRTYMEWSSGIGGQKSSKLFGELRRNAGK